MARRADIILLNGCARAGKSSIAKILQAELDEDFLHIEVDQFVHMLPQRAFESFDRYSEAFEPVGAGFHRSIRELRMLGSRLVVVHILRNPVWFSDLQGCLVDQRTLFVGLQCSLSTLRSRARTERARETIERQFPLVHAQAYDLEVDTESQTPEQCAAQILTAYYEGCGGFGIDLAERSVAP